VHSEIEIADRASLYAVNLAVGLHEQTQRRVIFIDAAGSMSVASEALALTPMPPVCLPEKLQKLDEIFSCITRHARGIDVLRVAPAANGTVDVALLLSLLTLLVNDYHYCLVHPPAGMGLDVYKLLVQADSVHLLALPDPDAIKIFMRRMNEAGMGADSDFKNKTRLIVLEDPGTHGQGAKLSVHAPEALFYQPVYATLPHVPDLKNGLVDSLYSTHYAKVLRRISRQTGEILLGLALGSGSAMGIAHIGVLKALEKEGIDIDLASGSSIGALIGALWCAGYTAQEVEEIILQSKSRKYLFGWDDLSFPLRGLLKGKHVRRFLEKYLEDKTFNDLNRPFAVVACDALTMKQVVFDSGRLVDAVMASISIPGVFTPYKIGARYYFDGGILNPLPTNILVASGAKRVIAVNVLPSADDLERTADFLTQKMKSAIRFPGVLGKAQGLWQQKVLGFFKPNIFDMIVSSVQSMEYSLAHISGLSQADVVLHPDVVAVSWADFENIEDLIKRGEEEAILHLQEIRNLLTQSE
jgi:predicted acylesterase/phospholipase RssA